MNEFISPGDEQIVKDPSREQKKKAFSKHADRSEFVEDVLAHGYGAFWADGTPWTQPEVTWLLLRDMLTTEEIVERVKQMASGSQIRLNTPDQNTA